MCWPSQSSTAPCVGSCGARCPVGSLPGYVWGYPRKRGALSGVSLGVVRKRCGRHHQCWSGRSMRSAGIRGPAHRRTSSSTTCQGVATGDAQVMGALVPLPSRACSTGRAPVVSCAHGQRTGPVDPSSLSADGHFYRSARLLPLEPKSSALPLSYLDVEVKYRIRTCNHWSGKQLTARRHTACEALRYHGVLRDPHQVRHVRSFPVLALSGKMFCAESTVCKERLRTG